MSADGISLQTTIVQSGTVAKAQMKGQQTQPQAAPLSEQTEQSKDLKVHRVKKGEEPEKSRINPEREEGRGRNRPGSDQEQAEPPQGGHDEGENSPGEDLAPEEIGRNIDTHA
jgi:hypothetical protein